MPNRNITLALIVALATVLAPLAGAQAQSNRGLIPRLFKSGNETRSAFAAVIEQARTSTVEVYCDGKQAVLGAVVDAEGYVITKASELSGKIECKFDGDKERLAAEIVGVHNGYDLAMLKIDRSDLTMVSWSPSEDAAVGQWVATVGIDDEPVAVGVISVPRRKIAKQPGALGIRRDENERGAKIAEVYENSAAADAGLKPGDVILQVDDKKIETFEELATTVRQHGPGDQLTLRVQRGKETFDVVVELSPMSILPMMDGNRGAIQNRMGGKLSQRRYGFNAVFQHDTVLKPEECGGPIVDLEGKVIGINIARAGRVESYAVPADVVRKLLPELKSGKLARSPEIGKVTPIEPEEPDETPATPEPTPEEKKDAGSEKKEEK